MVQRFFRKSIKVRLAVYMLLMVTIIVAMMTVGIAIAYQHYARQTLVANTTKQLKALAYSISAALEFHDRKLINESLALLSTSKEFLSATVRELDGTVFVEQKFPQTAFVLNFKQPAISLSIPVFNEMEKKTGFLGAEITLAYLNQEFTRNVKRIIAFSIIVLTGAFFLTFYLVRRFLKPLLGLKAAIKEMSSRGSVGSVPVVSQDEIGELAISFNELSENLKKTTTTRDRLIQEVEERKKAENELKETQSYLVQSEKMASIGQLAAGVAHEINNPIGFVTSNAEVLGGYVNAFIHLLHLGDRLKKEVEEGSIENARAIAAEIENYQNDKNVTYMVNDVHNLITETKSGLERVKKIVMDLRTFSRSDQGEQEPVQILDVVKSVLNLVHNEIKYKCDLQEEYQDVPLVMCNPQRLSQVLVNLIINASQSIDEKGAITIKTYQNGTYACIEVEDTGCGIPPDALSKLFDPFYSTKPVGQGTGLGLSISYEIITKLGGDIRVKSAEGRGSTFTVMLPTITEQKQDSA